MHKLKHKHKLKHCLLRLVAVPRSVLIWSAEDTFHLLNRFTLYAMFVNKETTYLLTYLLTTAMYTVS